MFLKFKRGDFKMARKKKQIDWFNIEDLFNECPDSQYYMIYSGRGKGKSYSTYKYIIDDYFKHGHHGFIMKRFESDMKGSRVSSLFSPLDEYVWENYQMKIRYYRNAFYMYIPTEDNKYPPISECELFCHTGALNISDRLKGMNYPQVKTIVLEEFMSMNSRYLSDEVNLLMNIVSTVFRHRTDGRIILLGNAISKFDPYSQLLGIKLYEINHGEIRNLEFKNQKGQQTKFTIHRATNVDVFDNEENKDQIVFNNFGDNGIGAMITDGSFQTGEFPKVTHGYYLSNITEKEYERLLNKQTRLIGQLTPEHDCPVFFKFDRSYYQVRMLTPTDNESLKLLNGQTIIGFYKVSEREFINKNPQSLKRYASQINFLITNDYEHVDTFYPTIIIHNLQNPLPYGNIEYFLRHILTAFSNGTAIYQDNECGQDVNNVLTLLGGM